MFHFSRVAPRILKLELRQTVDQIFDYCRGLDELGHQVRFCDVFKIVAKELALVESTQVLRSVCIIVCDCINEIFAETSQRVGHYFAEDWVCENARSDAIHCEDLDT